MKRVWMATAAAAVLVLTGCGGDEAVTTEPAAASSTTTSASPTTAAPAGSVNDDVRAACEAAVTEKLAGAQFPGRGALRAASSEGGKLFTVSGVADVAGTGHPYTCEVTVSGAEVAVGAVTVDGQ